MGVSGWHGKFLDDVMCRDPDRVGSGGVSYVRNLVAILIIDHLEWMKEQTDTNG